MEIIGKFQYSMQVSNLPQRKPGLVFQGLWLLNWQQDLELYHSTELRISSVCCNLRQFSRYKKEIHEEEAEMEQVCYIPWLTINFC